jgi:hypothetical protein
MVFGKSHSLFSLASDGKDGPKFLILAIQNAHAWEMDELLKHLVKWKGHLIMQKNTGYVTINLVPKGQVELWILAYSY